MLRIAKYNTITGKKIKFKSMLKIIMIILLIGKDMKII